MEPSTIELASARRTQPALWDGYYINLDRSPGRRLRIEQQLRDLGLSERYRRFRAVDGRALQRSAPIKPGEVGIYRSHLDLLQWIAVSGRLAHVLEDDAVLCDLTVPAIESAIRRLGTNFDILFTETFVPETVASIRLFVSAWQNATRRGAIENVERLQILDLSNLHIGSMSSYIVTPQGAAKLAARLSDEWVRGPTRPVDIIMQGDIRARHVRAYCIVPFVTTIDLESSRISQSDRDEQEDFVVLRQLIRYSFYIQRDLNGRGTPILDQIVSRLAPSESDPALEFNARILRYMLVPQASDG
jgi:GR25 family glycosyltransferase involved in LPS biosynthesis